MGTIEDKLLYLQDTTQLFVEETRKTCATVAESRTLRNYAEALGTQIEAIENGIASALTEDDLATLAALGRTDLASKVTYMALCKQSILSAIARKGVTVPDEQPFGTIADLIDQISTGEDSIQTYTLVTEDGEEIPAVTVSDETVFDATAEDIRAGKVAATAEGVTVGTLEVAETEVSE